MAANSLARQSRRNIANALIALMGERDFTRITVTEIAKKAGVARLTFYRHFKDKEAVLAYRTTLRLVESLEGLDRMTDPTLLDALTACLEAWRVDRPIVQRIHEQGLDPVVYEPFQDCLDLLWIRYGETAHGDAIIRDFVSGGIYQAVLSFVLDHPEVTSEEAAGRILKALDRDPDRLPVNPVDYHMLLEPKPVE